MPFTYEDTSGLNFVGKEEKAVLISEATNLPVEKVTFSETGKYGPRFVLHTTIDGEERALTFQSGSVESRDRLLESLQNYLENPEADPDFETPVVFMEQIKQSVILRVVSE